MDIYNHNITIISFKKNERIYAGTYAWACQVGYEEIVCLIGSQSDTGKAISKGDIVGVNVCSKEMKDEAIFIGSNHSTKINKLDDIKYFTNDDAILFTNAKVRMTCVVKDIIHLEGIEEDNLVYLKVIKEDQSQEAEYLLMSDLEK